MNFRRCDSTNFVTGAGDSFSKGLKEENMDKLCQNCQAPLTADAPRGLCPPCLMKVAMATGTVAGQEKPGFTPPSIEELARQFPHLEIIEIIGRGGMGAVYKARQKELDRIVALKILPPGIGDDAAFAERFAREAKALARLNHPGIITIHDLGRADGLYFFVMEFVDGVNLRQLLADGRVSPREALAIVPQICDALQFAHDQGIVHRDIKPENILLDRRGRVKVADFGLAKIVGMDAHPMGEAGAAAPGEGTQPPAALTDAGKIMGTPAYMAPEQVEHPAEVDHRADIYALGVVFYQMLTGELPGKAIEPPSKKVRIDVRLDEVVLRALEKKPELRYQQVSEVKTMVETIVGDAGVSPAKPGVATSFLKPEAEELLHGMRDMLTKEGLVLFAKRGLLFFADQALLLFDVYAKVPIFVERAGRRRLNFWLLLLCCSTIGFLINGIILAIALAQRLWHGTSPHGNAFALSIQDHQMLLYMVFSGVGRLAALNLGSNDVAGAGRAQAAKDITTRRVVVVFRRLMWLAALMVGGALMGTLMGKLMVAASTTVQKSIAGVAWWILICVAVGVFMAVGLTFIPVYIRVSRQVKIALAARANSNGVSPFETWLEIIDGGNYAQSWETAAAHFQHTISKEEWVGQMEKVRRPLGKVLSRKLSSTKFAAFGRHLEAKFATSFDGLLAATETVTFAVQPNGEWKAIGYRIRPAGDDRRSWTVKSPASRLRREQRR